MFERPLLMKAVVQIRVLKIGLANGRFTPNSVEKLDAKASDFVVIFLIGRLRSD